MAKHELELHAKFGLPEVHGLAARVEARYAGTWETRRRSMLEGAAERAGLTSEELGERLEVDERLGDVVWTAVQRVSDVGDHEYQSVLAALVAAACDDARIDEAAYLLSEIVKLEPIHLRALLRFAQTLWLSEDRSKKHVAPPSSANYVRKISCNERRLAGHLDVSQELAEAIIGRLSSAGFVEQAEPATASGEQKWRASSWALSALRMLFPNLERESP